jgi:hypothetical protein
MRKTKSAKTTKNHLQGSNSMVSGLSHVRRIGSALTDAVGDFSIHHRIRGKTQEASFKARVWQLCRRKRRFNRLLTSKAAGFTHPVSTPESLLGNLTCKVLFIPVRASFLDLPRKELFGF